jgi:iron uptake system component EfeO
MRAAGTVATAVAGMGIAVGLTACGSSSTGSSSNPAAPTAPASGNPATASIAVAASLDAATAAYADYVKTQVGELVTETQKLQAAVDSGDLEAAKAAYPAGRVQYEQIEPVAESFGDLDPDLDARFDDVQDPTKWTGFHRLEKALYQDKSLAGMQPVAAKLVADAEKLQNLVRTLTYQPAELGNGATSLLDEVAKTKVTGEEERYSHLDLLDMVANVDGARQAYTLLKPTVEVRNPALAAKIDAGFAGFDSTVAPYQQGDGWASYDQVTAAQRKQISNAVNALAEPLSQLSAVVVA